MQFATKTSMFTAWALAIAAGPLSAQQPEGQALLSQKSAVPTKSVQRQSHAVQEIDGTLTGFGHRFKTSFEPGRVEFLPALGKEAPRNFPLSFSLESVRRGATIAQGIGLAVTPFDDNGLVTYSHGAMEERYEVKAEGVYQSFLFHERPAGAGDLVVRGRLNTDLIPELLADGSLLFQRGNGSGLSYGAVTGIDANGWSVPGSLNVDGNALELILPASFVEQASFPLLLDPLIGTVIEVDDSASVDSSPEIAIASIDYLVVWERNFSLSHGEVYGQRVQDDGDLDGGLIAISTGAGIIARQPAAGYVSAEGNYLVAYTYAPNFLVQPQIRCRNIPRSIFSPLFGSTAVSASGNSQSSPDVGGDQTGSDNEAFVVWRESNVGIRGRTVTALDDASPSPIGSTFTIDPDTATTVQVDPKVSKNIFSGTNFLVVWEEQVTGSSNRRFIWGRMYTRNGAALTNVTDFDGLSIQRDESPDCDGDADTFFVAWQQSETLAGSEYDIVGRSIHWNGSSMSLGSLRDIENHANDDETQPSVAMTSSNVIVAYLDQDPGGLNGYVRNVDPFTAISFGEQILAGGALVTKVSVAGRPTSDDVMVSWDDANLADIFAQKYDGVGNVSTIGGGCGVEGRAVLPCALAGNSDFRIHLRDATPGVLAACVTGVNTFPIACGTCTLWPNVEVVYYDTTDSFGNASVNIPLPLNFADVTFYSQWVTFVPVGACPLAPIDFTDAKMTTISGTP